MLGGKSAIEEGRISTTYLCITVFLPNIDTQGTHSCSFSYLKCKERNKSDKHKESQVCWELTSAIGLTSVTLTVLIKLSS